MKSTLKKNSSEILLTLKCPQKHVTDPAFVTVPISVRYFEDLKARARAAKSTWRNILTGDLVAIVKAAQENPTLKEALLSC